MPSLYGVAELHELVKAHLQANGVLPEHDFGSEHLDSGREATNVYTWVPIGTETDGGHAVRGKVDEPDPIYGTIEKFDIFCDGKTHETAYLMARNIVAAIRRIMGVASLRFIGGEWETPRGGSEPKMGVGRLYVLHLGLVQIWADEIVPIDLYERDVDQTLTAPNVPTTTPTGAVVTTFSSPNPSTDGELAATDTVLP
jgi:hypothetical protein